MTEAKRVSEITIQDVANYLRLAEVSSDDQTFLTSALEAAKTFIQDYTGLKPSMLDDYPSFVIVVYVLCQDFYDNRSLYVDKTNLNKMVDSILGMYSVNLL